VVNDVPCVTKIWLELHYRMVFKNLSCEVNNLLIFMGYCYISLVWMNQMACVVM